MAVGNPFGLPLFNRLGIGAPSVRAGSPTSSVEPNYDGFSRRAGPLGFEGPDLSQIPLSQLSGNAQPLQQAPVLGPGFGPSIVNTTNQLPPGFGPSIVNTGDQRAVPAAVETAPPFRQPGDLGRYVAFNDPGEPGEGFSSYQDYLAAGNSPATGGSISSISGPGQPGGVNLVGSPNNLAVTGVGMFPLPPPVNNPLNPNRPGPPNIGPLPNPDEGFDMSNPVPFLPSLSTLRPPQSTFPTNRPNFGGGLSNMAFPSLAPSSTNTFTGGLFGAFNNAMNNSPMNNNPMSNNSMNGGGMGGNQPLSQQIPQAVQQAVTPLLQNTASQLNQGIGSMVNQRLVGS